VCLETPSDREANSKSKDTKDDAEPEPNCKSDDQSQKRPQIWNEKDGYMERNGLVESEWDEKS